MSFMPFLAGKRVCVGKTFAENALKIVASLILKAFPQIEFVDPDQREKKPINNIGLQKRPVILLRLLKD
jgi:cytochrome P450